jgi:Zn-dependent hydrolases, including glyoxylases
MSTVTTLPLGLANAFLIRDRGTVMVDTGINVPREKYLELFAACGVDPASLRLLVITHGHRDHFAGAAVLKEITGAPVACHRAAAQFLRGNTSAAVTPRNDLGKKMAAMLRKDLPSMPVEPDVLIDGEFDLTPYGVGGRIIPTPGHTGCSLSVVLDSGTAIAGDMVVTSFVTGQPVLAYFAEDQDALFTSVELLLQKAGTIYGGHGGPFTRAEVEKLLAVERTDLSAKP